MKRISEDDGAISCPLTKFLFSLGTEGFGNSFLKGLLLFHVTFTHMLIVVCQPATPPAPWVSVVTVPVVRGAHIVYGKLVGRES